MISVSGVRKATIRSHYQLGTLFYRLLWGPHIHHGLWDQEESQESALVAQCQLTDTLADMAKIVESDKVIDVGCGMGGSSIRLARLRGCDVTGVTLSPVQKYWATVSSKLKGVGGKTRFLAEDAEQIVVPENSIDVMWSVECTEHLFDKPAFFERAAKWLRPGGRMAICVWFEGEDTSRAGHRELVEEVCTRFVCPSLGTRVDYAKWITDSGLRVTHSVDWTNRSAKTWEICQHRVQRMHIRRIAQILDKDQVEFIDGFDTLLRAYRTGAMAYGAIVARKD
jgi:tocopherol O-methyltransferase